VGDGQESSAQVSSIDLRRDRDRYRYRHFHPVAGSVAAQFR